MKHLFLIIASYIIFSTPSFSQNSNSLLFTSLPDYCPTPDNLAIAPDGSITLTCPNYAGNKDGVIVSIKENLEVEILTKLPGNDKIKHGRPKGLDYAPDGTLYVCNAKGNKDGEINRITFNNNQVSSIEVIAKGLNPNGLKYHKGYIYITQPRLKKVNDSTMLGAVFRFHESERNIVIKDAENSPHIFFKTLNTNPQRQFGIDGLCFDTSGNLYLSEFGDATIFKLHLDDNSNITKEEIYAQLPTSTGLDGMIMDNKNRLFVVGFSSNQLIMVKPDKTVKIIAQYPDNDGAQGELDQPVDLVIYKDKLLISNFDLMAAPGMVNTGHSKPYTISYIPLNELKNE